MHTTGESQITKTLVFGILTYGIGSAFYYGYGLAVTNVPQKVVQAWINETHMMKNRTPLSQPDLDIIWTIVTSIYAVGGIAGGCIVSTLWKKVGRKNALFINNFVSIIGAVLVGVAKTTNSYYVFMAGRFIIGIVAAIHSALAPQFLTEIAPVNIRGAVGALYGIFGATGITAAQIIGLPVALGTESLWPIAFALIAVPSICQFVMLIFCPESPKYLLITNDDIDGARKALIRYRGHANVEGELQAFKVEKEYMNSLPKVYVKDFFTKSYLGKPLLISVVMMSSQFLTGIGALLYYSTGIFEKVDVPEHQSGYGTVGVGSAFFVGGIIAAMMLVKLGRRVMYIGSLAVLFVLSIMFFLIVRYQSQATWLSYVAVVLSIVFVLVYSVGPGIIPWFFVYEMFLQNAAGIAGGVSIVVSWSSVLVAGLMWLPLQAAIGQYSFLVFTGLITFYGVFSFFLVPETRGRSIEETVASFARKSNTITLASLGVPVGVPVGVFNI